MITGCVVLLFIPDCDWITVTVLTTEYQNVNVRISGINAMLTLSTFLRACVSERARTCV